MTEYRRLLEVLKCSDPREVLTEFCCVCGGWSRTAGSDELWDCLAEVYAQAPRSKTERASESFRRFALYGCQVPCFTASELILKNCLTSTAAHISHRDQYMSGYFLTLLNPTTVLLTGGSQLSSLDLRHISSKYGTEGVEIGQEMILGRCRHAAVVVRRRVYVFGGLVEVSSAPRTDPQPTASCERLDLVSPFKSTQWQDFPSMLTARTHFTTSPHDTKVYICGGRKVTASEVFDTTTLQYTQLSFTVPETEYSFSALVGKTLTVFGDESVTTVSLKDWSTQVTYYAKDMVWHVFGTITVANLVVLGDFVYKDDETGVVRFDLKSHTPERVLMRANTWLEPEEQPTDYWSFE